MPFPRLKLTIQQFMIVILAVAVVLGMYEWRTLSRRRERYLIATVSHAKEAEDLRRMLESVETMRNELVREDPTVPAYEEYTHRRADYHAEMSRRYRAAADRPWQSDPPDPGVPRQLRASGSRIPPLGNPPMLIPTDPAPEALLERPSPSKLDDPDEKAR